MGCIPFRKKANESKTKFLLILILQELVILRQYSFCSWPFLSQTLISSNPFSIIALCFSPLRFPFNTNLSNFLYKNSVQSVLLILCPISQMLKQTLIRYSSPLLCLISSPPQPDNQKCLSKIFKYLFLF